MFGATQRRPKRLYFAVDVSRSMGRMNGEDRRLDRLAAVIVMIMEAFDSMQHKFDYAVYGHDGESCAIPFVRFGKPPATRAERLDVVDAVYWNALFCATGDTTLSAAERGVREVVAEEGDDYFLFVISDANLAMYGVTPQSLASAVLSDHRVNSYCIFIASEEDASTLVERLPPGHGFACLDTSKMPQIFRNVFTDSLAGGASGAGEAARSRM